MSEHPPFDLGDFAIEGWEVRAQPSSLGGWEVIWRRNARYVARLVPFEWLQAPDPAVWFARIVAHVQAYIAHCDARGWPDG